MQIYAQEIQDGLSEKLLKSNSISFEITPSNVESAFKNSHANLYTSGNILKDGDLLYFNSILTSVGWNKNDDVFDGKELWRARGTPVNKKINFMHNEKDIIGHMTNSNVIDFSGQFVPDNVNEESIPNEFDIVVGGYIYKHWQDNSLQERMATILSQVDKQELAVSMECIFPNFDYAIISPDGEQRFITRSDDTAFLTKHLRMYGGNGSYEGFKVGRLLRNMIFTGNALVDRPANPRSQILKKDILSFSGTIASIDILISKKMENKNMDNVTKEQYDVLLKRLESAEAVAKEVVKKELDSLKETNTKLTQNISELGIQLSTAKEDNKKLSGELTAAKEVAKSHEDTSAKLSEEIKTLEASLAKAKADLDNYNKEMCKSKRKSAMAQIDVDDARANELIEKLSAVSDEIFDEFVKNMPKKVVKTDATASVKETLDKAKDKDVIVVIPSETQTLSTAKAAEWFASTLSSKKNGE